MLLKDRKVCVSNYFIIQLIPMREYDSKCSIPPPKAAEKEDCALSCKSGLSCQRASILAPEFSIPKPSMKRSFIRQRAKIE